MEQPYSVRVYDSLLQPLVGTSVSLVDRTGKVLAAGVSGEGGLWRTASADGWVYGRATAPGHISSRAPLSRSASSWTRRNVSLHLYEAVTVRGTVRDDRGEPVPRAHVCVDVRGWLFVPGRMELAESRCDGSGQFALTNVPLTDVFVTAWADGHVLGQTLVRAGDTTADVVLARGSGRELELHLDGEEVPSGCSVRVDLTLNEKEGRTIKLPTPLREHTLGAKRTLRVRGLPDNDSEIRIKSRVEGAKRNVSPRWVGPLAVGVKAVRFAVSKSETRQAPVAGVLRDERGAALPGVTLRLIGDAREEVLVSSNDEGRFHADLPVAVGGRLSVYLKDSDRVLVEREPAKRQAFDTPRPRYRRGQDLELVAVPSAIVSGQLKLADGRDPSGLAVGIELAGESTHWVNVQTEVGADGRFVLRGFAAFDEPFWLVVEELRGSARVGPFQLGGKQVLQKIEVRVVPPAEVRGRVTDGNGNSVAGAWVAIRGSEVRGPFLKRITSTLSDRNGRYVLRGARPGTYTITAFKALATSSGEEVELVLSQQTEHDLEIVK